jgi:hypothetical protein
MIYVSLRKWSGQFQVPGVVGKIRRTIAAGLAQSECVVVLDDGAKGLTLDIRHAIEQAWPPEKVRFSRTHPALAGKSLSPPRRRWRGR